MWRVTERLDPEARVAQDVPIEEVVQEYRLIVSVVRDAIEERGLDVSFDQYTYFYDAIFELTAESVRRYTEYRRKQVQQERTRYLAGIAHQMRSPLSALTMQVELLRAGEPMTSEDVDALGRVARRLRVMVDGVLRLERFQPHELPVRPAVVVPAELVEQVRGDVAREAERKGLRLETDVDDTLRMEVDLDLLLDVLVNLVENALHYTSEGFVRIEVRKATDEEAGEGVLFRVINSGPGIEAERQDELFQLVQSERSGGFGVGLVVARRAVEAQGGRIGVESAPGEGACFWFCLPRHVEARA